MRSRLMHMMAVALLAMVAGAMLGAPAASRAMLVGHGHGPAAHGHGHVHGHAHHADDGSAPRNELVPAEPNDASHCCCHHHHHEPSVDSDTLRGRDRERLPSPQPIAIADCAPRWAHWARAFERVRPHARGRPPDHIVHLRTVVLLT
ncbi:MAG: hypothetical protein NCW75_04840 [Phycisphaera sp.]|nr:MAG: hypothetical protein NCW75_04840 [Phycisphaera sp.]